jgi:hypothetical protein
MRSVSHASPRLLLTAVFLASCAADPWPDDTDQVLTLEVCPGPVAEVGDAWLDGDDLVVVARYGGCGMTRTWACWDGLQYDSDPPQVRLRVHHEPAGPCDALLTQHARISLAPMWDLVERDGPIRVFVNEQELVRQP